MFILMKDIVNVYLFFFPVYELWFKEIIHELDSVMEIFDTLVSW